MMKKEDINDSELIEYIYLWSPSIVTFIIFLYNIIDKGVIEMKDWLTLIGAVAAAVIAAGVAIWKENRNSKRIVEKVEERHTLATAEKYHELELEELEKFKQKMEGLHFAESEKLNSSNTKINENHDYLIRIDTLLSMQQEKIRNSDTSTKGVETAMNIINKIVQDNADITGMNGKLIQENLELKGKISNMEKKINIMAEENKKLTEKMVNYELLETEYQALKDKYEKVLIENKELSEELHHEKDDFEMMME